MTRKTDELNARAANIIETRTNHEAGLRTEISIHERGYAVSMIDIDCCERANFIKILPTIERAREYAFRIIGAE